MTINKWITRNPYHTGNSFTYQSWAEFSFSSHSLLCGNKISFLFFFNSTIFVLAKPN